MARQVRLDDEVAEWVARSGPDEDSLTSKANRLLRQLREGSIEPPPAREWAAAANLDPPAELVPSPEVAMPRARTRVRPERPRSRSAAPRPAADDVVGMTLERLRTPPLEVVPRPRSTAGACPHPLLLRRCGKCGKCGEPVV